jgi:hypothetical protein
MTVWLERIEWAGWKGLGAGLQGPGAGKRLEKFHTAFIGYIDTWYEII